MDFPRLSASDWSEIAQSLALGAQQPVVEVENVEGAHGREQPFEVVPLTGATTPLDETKEEASAARDRARGEAARWCFLDPQGAVQGPYHRMQMRFWFEKGYFEMKTPVRNAVSGSFVLLGDAFPHSDADPQQRYVYGFLDSEQIAQRVAKAQAEKVLPKVNREGTWKQKHLKVPSTTENPFPNEDFESPGQELYHCCQCGDTSAALRMIAAGADVHWVNHNDMSCLAVAAKRGEVEVCRALLKMGVAVNHENLWHMTALHEAARGNQATMIRVLVEEFGADMEIRDLDGYKPIHTACTESAVEAIRELVLLGSTTTIRDNHNWTPIMHVLANAPDGKKEKIIQLIKKEVE